jgi:hypothetical protein
MRANFSGNASRWSTPLGSVTAKLRVPQEFRGSGQFRREQSGGGTCANVGTNLSSSGSGLVWLSCGLPGAQTCINFKSALPAGVRH